jgi:DUF4097 and DUF4098 domain-containing protein YvlB
MGRLTAISTVAALFVVVAAFAATEDFEWSGGSGAKALEISNVSGDIDVNVGGDAVVVRATKNAATPEALKGVNVEVREKGSKVIVETEYPKHAKGESNIRIDFDVTLPEGVELAASTVSGDVTVAGVKTVEASTVSGTVNVSGAYEKASVSTVSGDAIIDNPSGATKRLAVETVEGDIEAKASLPDGGGDYVFSAVDGDIILTLSGNLDNYDVELDSLSGEVKTDLPIKKESKFVGTEYEGSAGAGSNEINVSTVSGSITLKTE